MPTALIFNPGSNSLKFELVEVADTRSIAYEATKLAQCALDDIGKQSRLSVYNSGRVVDSHSVDAKDMREAARFALTWLREHGDLQSALAGIALVGVRVVHGGSKYTRAVRVNDNVRRDIELFGELAPLHNQQALDILDVLAKEMSQTPVYVTFDTAFHQTLPEKAWRYPIEREVADKYGIRKFGFHGVSHRYMLERYADVVGKEPQDVTVVTMHLEGGSSLCAIKNGRSVDTTMGFTPLEGLMMGSRSGSIDPAIVPFLMRKEKLSETEVLKLLNKHSGLIGIAGESVDTRVLEKRDDKAARLALSMFSYRVRMAVGAYLAALGDAEAIVFGGGIGVDSPWARADVCEGLKQWGVEIDAELNARTTKDMTRLSKNSSHLQVWTIPVEEGLQIAHECMFALQRETGASTAG